MTRYFDLHTHSCYSDGTDTPTDLIKNAKAAGLHRVALTDHDTVQGLSEASTQAEKSGIEFVHGIELSSKDKDCSMHILGLGIQYPEALNAITETLKQLRQARNTQIATQLEAVSHIPLSYTDFEKKATCVVGKPHIVQAMLEKGIITERKEAYSLLKTLSYSSARIPAIQAIEAIHQAGAHSYLAHPCLVKLQPDQLENKLKELKEMGLFGLECFYTKHTAIQTRFYLELAKKLELKVSGGSDYHGSNKPGVFLGKGMGTQFLFPVSGRERI